jgi:hypothetical protein
VGIAVASQQRCSHWKKQGALLLSSLKKQRYGLVGAGGHEIGEKIRSGARILDQSIRAGFIVRNYKHHTKVGKLVFVHFQYLKK